MTDRKVTAYEVDRNVAVVTLRRPERLNAWTVRMEQEYREAMSEADDDPDVRAVVLTGSGRGFCAGADTQALTAIRATGRYEAGSPDRGTPSDSGGPGAQSAFAFTLDMSKPVIAAVNGPAAGVGFVLMCFADIRFAAAGAKLTTSFGRLGLPAEHGVSWILPRIVGAARAADLLFSSRVVIAEEAEAMGLVNKVLPPDELLRFTLDYAAHISAEISPWSLRAMKRQLVADLGGTVEQSAARATALMHEAFTRVDFKEGVAALTEKRPPRFPPLS